MNTGGKLTGTWKNRQHGLNVSLSIISFEDSGSIVFYCPALDVSGYGKSDSEAEHSLFTSMSEFFTYTLNKNTFLSELRRLGWTIRNSKRKPMTPPTMTRLLEENENFSNIFNKFDFKKFDQQVSLPV